MFTASLVANFVGILVFLFIFWKRLKEDFAAEIIFRSSFYILLGVLAGYLVSLNFFPSWFLWIEFLGIIVGLSISIYFLKMRFYETFEALIISVLPWLGFIFLADSVARTVLGSFLAFIVILIMVFMAYWLDTHYKSFAWYKSGKIGFAGMATLGIIFLIRSLIAISGITMLSFVGKIDAIMSGVLAFGCFLLLYNLGRITE